MDIRFLRYFLAVASEQNITNAARSLHIAQSTLSKELRQLEDEIGVELFIRTNRSVTLTDEGIYFQKKAKEIVELSDKLENEFKNGIDTIHGDLYIGAGESLSFRTLADFISEFSERYPGVCFHFYSGDGDSIRAKLTKGLVDFAMLMEGPELLLYNSCPLPYEEQWGFYIPKDDPLVKKGFLTAEDIINSPIIIPERTGLDSVLVQWAGVPLDRLRIIGRYTLMYNISFLVSSHLGYAFGINGLTNETEAENIVFLPIRPIKTIRYHLVWKKEPQKRVSKTFIEEFIKKRIKKDMGI